MSRTARNKTRSLDYLAVTKYLHAHYGILSGQAIVGSYLNPVCMTQSLDFCQCFARESHPLRNKVHHARFT
jgi:hypothetical protein